MRSKFLLAAAFLLSACAGSPDSRYYTLSPVTGQPSAKPAYRLAGLRLPTLYDRPQMATRNNANEVEFSEFERWAEPLERMTARILALDIAARHPQRTADAPKLTVNIDEFMADRSGQARLSGSWKLQNREVPFSLSRPVSGQGSGQVAQAMSDLLGQLADEIDRAS